MKEYLYIQDKLHVPLYFYPDTFIDLFLSAYYEGVDWVQGMGFID